MRKLMVVSERLVLEFAQYGFEKVSAEEAFVAVEQEKGRVQLMFELPKKEGVVTTEISRVYVSLFAFLEGGWRQGWLLPSTVLLICHPLNIREVTWLAVTNEVTFDVLCDLSSAEEIIRKFIGSNTVCLQKRRAEIRGA